MFILPDEGIFYELFIPILLRVKDSWVVGLLWIGCEFRFRRLRKMTITLLSFSLKSIDISLISRFTSALWETEVCCRFFRWVSEGLFRYGASVLEVPCAGCTRHILTIFFSQNWRFRSCIVILSLSFGVLDFPVITFFAVPFTIIK